MILLRFLISPIVFFGGIFREYKVIFVTNYQDSPIQFWLFGWIFFIVFMWIVYLIGAVFGSFTSNVQYVFTGQYGDDPYVSPTDVYRTAEKAIKSSRNRH